MASKGSDYVPPYNGGGGHGGGGYAEVTINDIFNTERLLFTSVSRNLLMVMANTYMVSCMEIAKMCYEGLFGYLRDCLYALTYGGYGAPK